MMTKTKEVHAIEQHLGLVLNPARFDLLDADWHQAYCIDEQNCLVALSLTLSDKDDLSFLRDLPHLEKLFLRISGGVEVRIVRSGTESYKQYLDKDNLDLSFLQGLPMLAELGVRYASISDSQNFIAPQKLRKLTISWSKIQNANFLNVMQSLECIVLYHNELESEASLYDLPNLKEILFEGNQMEALHLGNLPVLQKAAILETTLQTLTIEKCDALETIALRDTRLKIFAPTNLPALNNLKILGTPLDGLSLQDLPALQNLEIIGGSIKELSLHNLPALQALHLENMPLEKVITEQKLIFERLVLRKCGLNNLDMRLLFEAFEEMATAVGYPDLDERLKAMRTEFETTGKIVYHHDKPLNQLIASSPKFGKWFLERSEKLSQQPDYVVWAMKLCLGIEETYLTIQDTRKSFEESFDFQQARHLDLSNNKLATIDFLRGSCVERLVLDGNDGLKLEADVLESMPHLTKLNVKNVMAPPFFEKDTFPARIAEKGKEAVIAFLKKMP